MKANTEGMYHLSPITGRPERCGARKKPCPYGGDRGEHYKTREEAQEAYETLNAEKYGVSATFIANSEEVDSSVSEILKKTSKRSFPKKITESYAVETIFSGDEGKLDFIETISQKPYTDKTKAAIGKISVREDIQLSYNEINKENFEGSVLETSYVDLIDEESHPQDIKEYVLAGAKDLPWN